MNSATSLACALAIAVVGAPASGHAAPTRERPRVAVLPTATTGQLEDHWQVKLADRLLAGLVRVEFEVVAVAGAEAAACGDAVCRRELAASANAQYLVAAGITAGDRQYRVAVELVEGSTGGVIVLASRDCDVCTVEEVGELLADATGELRTKLDLLASGPPLVAIASNPSGAMVELDGKPIGQTPLEQEVRAGAHAAKITKQGYVAQRLTLHALPGHREALTLELVALPPVVPRPQPQRHRDLRPWGWAAAGLGGAGLAAGAALLAIDGRPDRRSCRGSGVDGDGDCRYLYDSTRGGATLVAVGAGAIVSGIVMLAVHARRTAKQRRGRPSAAMRGS